MVPVLTVPFIFFPSFTSPNNFSCASSANSLSPSTTFFPLMLNVNNRHVIRHWFFSQVSLPRFSRFNCFSAFLRPSTKFFGRYISFTYVFMTISSTLPSPVFHLRLRRHFLYVQPEQGLTVLRQIRVRVHDTDNLFLLAPTIKEWWLWHHVTPIPLLGIVNPDLTAVGFIRVVRYLKGKVFLSLLINETGTVQYKCRHGLVAEREGGKGNQCLMSRPSHRCLLDIGHPSGKVLPAPFRNTRCTRSVSR